MSAYFGGWENFEQMREDFKDYSDEVSPVPADIDVIAAVYTYEDYSGSAFVLYRYGGKLYEVNGSHCSCYGLEGQWTPEEVLLTELANRPVIFSEGSWYPAEKEMETAIRGIVNQLIVQESAQ